MEMDAKIFHATEARGNDTVATANQTLRTAPRTGQREGELAYVQSMNRMELEIFCRAKDMPTTGTIHEIRERASQRALDGTPEAVRTTQLRMFSDGNALRWWPNRRGKDQRMTQLELSQLNRVEGFYFLFMQDLIIQNLDDWSDGDLWSTVWAYMIPVMPADSTSPSDEGRLARAIQLSPALTLQLPSAERTCELIPLHAVPLNSTIRV